MNKIVIVAAVFLAGCASNSGVTPIGQDTYMVSRQAATGFSGSGCLKRKHFKKQANIAQSSENRCKW